MNTPICDFLKKYKRKNALRLHMPGHKGNGFLGTEEFDITEIKDVFIASLDTSGNLFVQKKYKKDK